MTNDNKVAFIICTNNETYYSECVWYIKRINIPEGFEIDIISIQDAESMAEAYNAAMESSDAKYKVYLHQDVFIYNRNFISDFVNVFRSDEQIGMLGVIGGVNLPKDAIIWNAWNKGWTYACNFRQTLSLRCSGNSECGYTEVEAIDGMLMITQYDVRWREDLDLGWDFYDVSQSLEFRRNGYKVAIPNQEKAWCLHDCGHSKLENYDVARQKILKEYKSFFEMEYRVAYPVEKFEVLERISQGIKTLLEKGDFSSALSIREDLQKVDVWNNSLIYSFNMLDIFVAENRMISSEGSFFFGINSWDAMKEKYDIIKFTLRRVENGEITEDVLELAQLMAEGAISRNAIRCIANCSVLNKEVVYNAMCELSAQYTMGDEVDNKKLTVVMVAYNEVEHVKLSVESFRMYSDVEVALVIADNGSSDGLREWAENQTDITYVCMEERQNYGSVINQVLAVLGIEDDLLVLEGHYVITEGFLSKTMELLYQEEQIGAVGALSNGFEKNQLLKESGSMKEIGENLIQAMTLCSGAILYKREAIKRLGQFDDNFFSAHHVMKDYSLRLLENGYKSIICPNAVLWDLEEPYYSYKLYLSKWQQDEMKLRDKWNVQYLNDAGNMDIVRYIEEDREAEITVMEIGCDCAATLLAIKNRYPNAKLYGTDLNARALNIAQHFAEVCVNNIEEENLPYEENSFDYIILGDVLEHLHNPERTIRYCKKMLKEEGHIVASIPNVMHISVMEQLLKGDFTYTETGLLDKTHIHLFTYKEILRLFEQNGYKVLAIGSVKNSISEEQQALIEKLMRINMGAERFMYETFQYVIKVKKAEE